jgi:hypothetical protein
LIHPDSELRFISPAMGYGLFATTLIPKGTITWVADALDQILPPEHYAALPELLRAQVFKYSYLNNQMQRILCWDHGRFVNHSCAATCLSPGFDFEIAVRDIAEGDEITDDYGTLNPEQPFSCLCGALNCRGTVLPDDAARYAAKWHAQVVQAFPLLRSVGQPLWSIVKERADVERVLRGEISLPTNPLPHARRLNAPVRAL